MISIQVLFFFFFFLQSWLNNFLYLSLSLSLILGTLSVGHFACCSFSIKQTVWQTVANNKSRLTLGVLEKTRVEHNCMQSWKWEGWQVWPQLNKSENVCMEKCDINVLNSTIAHVVNSIGSELILLSLAFIIYYPLRYERNWKTGHGSSPVLSSTTKTHSSTYCTAWNVSEFSLLFGHMHCTTFSLILVVKRTDGLMKDEKFARSSCSGFIAQWLEHLTGNRNTQVRSAAGLRSCRRWFSSDPAVKSYFCLRGKGKSLMFFLRLAMIIPKSKLSLVTHQVVTDVCGCLP